MPMTFFADSAAATGGSVPFQRMVDPSKIGMFLNLEQAELLRLQRYREHWRFYYGKHWQFVREDGDPLVTLNYFKKIIDKSASFLCSKGFVAKVPEPLQHHTSPFIQEVWKANGKEKLLWDMALTGGVTGDVFVLVTYTEPTPLERRIFPFSKGRIVLNLLGSEQVFPDWDPLNKGYMRSVRIETLFYDARPVAPIGADDRSSEGRQLNIRRYTQIITPDSITEHLQGEDPTVRPNILGEIPLVHIKNLPAPNEPYGIPDGLEILDVNREINEKATDCSDMVNYHAAPITVITGAKAKQLERGPRQIWSGLPSDASVFNLQLEGDLGAAKDYVDFVKEALMELSDTPEGSLGKMQAISNTAGVALHLQYGPLMEKTVKKRAQYAPGIELINYYILRIGQVMGMVQVPYDIDRKSGGKIALVEVPVEDEGGNPVKMPDGTPLTRRDPRSFYMDPKTLQFMDPMDLKIKYLRQYSFGSEVREEPYWRVMAESRGISKSFWDPEPETTIDDEQERKRGEANVQLAADDAAKPPPSQRPAATGDGGGTPPPAKKGPAHKITPKKASAPKLPPQFIDIPPEPEEVTVVVQYYDAKTGELAREAKTTRTLVPTGEELPEYLNPYETTVAFNDPLPKDLHLQAQLYQSYLNMEIVSRKWIQEHIPEIAPFIEEIERQRDAEAAERSVAGTGVPTELQGDELGREYRATDQPPSATEGANVNNRNRKERDKDTGRQ